MNGVLMLRNLILIVAIVTPYHCHSAEKPDLTAQRKKWNEWSEETKKDLQKDLSEATKVSGRGKSSAGILWIGIKNEVAAIYSDKPDETFTSLEIQLKPDDHVVKIGNQNEVTLESRFPIPNGPEFFYFKEPVAVHLGDATDRFFLDGFFRPNQSSYWFLHDKMRPNLKSYREYKIYSYNDNFLLPVKISKIDIKGEEAELVLSINDREFKFKSKLLLDYNFLHLFFYDPTNGNGTYSGGRMLEIELDKPGKELVPGEIFWIDFNHI